MLGFSGFFQAAPDGIRMMLTAELIVAGAHPGGHSSCLSSLFMLTCQY
jgi:hypothetical protein